MVGFGPMGSAPMGAVPTFAEEGAREGLIVVSSAAWTGLPRTPIDDRNAAVVIHLIDQALEKIAAAELNNVQIAEGRAFLLAARALCEAPEPPSALIWKFIGRAADVTSLITVFCAIFSTVSS